MPFAARVNDLHVCPKSEPGPVPHAGGPITGPGVATVLIGGMAAAVKGDMAVCVGPIDKINSGSGSVLIGGKEAARLGDTTEHGGAIIQGFATVIIGD